MFYVRKGHEKRRISGWLLMWMALLWLLIEAGTDWVKDQMQKLVLEADLKKYEDWLKVHHGIFSILPLLLVGIVGSPFKYVEVELFINCYWICGILVFFLAKALL